MASRKGRGGITRHPTRDLWMARYTDGNGRRRAIYSKDYEEVKRELNQALANRDVGLNFDAGAITLQNYLSDWLADCVKDSVSVRTYQGYESLVRVHINPVIGRIQLRKLNPSHARKLYRLKLDEGLAPRTVRYIHTTLHKAIKQAVNDGLIPRNITSSVKTPKDAKTEVKVFSQDELARFVEVAHKDRLEALWLFALTTGARSGEILALDWDSIDFDKGTVEIIRSLCRTTKEGVPTFTPTKNSSSRRKISLTRITIEALKRHKVMQNQERLKAGSDWKDYGLVFSSRVGTPILGRHLNTRLFKRLLRQAGLADTYTFHTLRHQFATTLLRQNVNPKVVQRAMGHSSIVQTMDTYSHLLDDMQNVARDAMEQALG